jgi:hypothetical protein
MLPRTVQCSRPLAAARFLPPPNVVLGLRPARDVEGGRRFTRWEKGSRLRPSRGYSRARKAALTPGSAWHEGVMPTQASKVPALEASVARSCEPTR